MADPQDPPHGETDDAGSTPPAKSPRPRRSRRRQSARQEGGRKTGPAKKPGKKASLRRPAGCRDQRPTFEAAKDVAAQAKSAVEGASNPVPRRSDTDIEPVSGAATGRPDAKPVAILLVRQLRRR